MKKEYVKPELEYTFFLTEVVTSDFIDPSIGEGGGVPGWE